jgi:hypothetical protein
MVLLCPCSAVQAVHSKIYKIIYVLLWIKRTELMQNPWAIVYIYLKSKPTEDII